jgi:predicted nucleic acid-binding protein
MNYLLDTNHWSYLQRRNPQVVDRLEQLPRDSNLFMSVVSQAELLVGVESMSAGRRQTELRQLYEQVIAETADIVPVDSQVAERFASVFVQQQRAGRPIETNDIWLAATALAHDLTMVSNDAHLGFVEGLRIEDWTQS